MKMRGYAGRVAILLGMVMSSVLLTPNDASAARKQYKVFGDVPGDLTP